jgi:cytoskeletal protein RodZ
VRVQWLALIDDERLDELPAEVFVRGYVSSYARVVGADEKLAAGMLARRIEERRAAAEAALEGPFVDVLRELDGGRRRMGVALAVIVLLIAATLMVSMLLHRPAPAAGPISLGPALVDEAPRSQAG